MNRFQQDLAFEQGTSRPCAEMILTKFFDATQVVWTDGDQLDRKYDVDAFVVLKSGRRIAVSCKSHRPKHWDYRTEITQEYYSFVHDDDSHLEEGACHPWFCGIASVHLELYVGWSHVEWWLIDTLQFKIAKNIQWQFKQNEKHGSASFMHTNGYSLQDLGCVLEHGTVEFAGLKDWTGAEPKQSGFFKG